MSNAQYSGLTSAESEFTVVGTPPTVSTTGPSEAAADGSTTYQFTASHDSAYCSVTWA